MKEWLLPGEISIITFDRIEKSAEAILDTENEPQWICGRTHPPQAERAERYLFQML